MTLKETIFIRKQANYWYETVTELIKDPLIALVGFDYSTPPLDDDEEARVFAKEHNCIFKIISCVNGNIINELFQEIGKQLIYNTLYKGIFYISDKKKKNIQYNKKKFFKIKVSLY